MIALNLSGPYAVGKDTILNELLARYPARTHRVSTITTRPVSKDADPTYTHVEPEEFQRIVAGPDWIANYQLGGHTAYATNIQEIRTAASEGLVSVLSVYPGPDGAGALRAALGRSLQSISIMPSTGDLVSQLAELESRLVSRNRDSEDAIRRRLDSQTDPIRFILDNPMVETEDGELHVFDSVVINERLDYAIAEVVQVMEDVLSSG